jgi:hypothetical protein
VKVFRQRICDDRLVRINSCLVLAVSRDGTEITTVEGLGEEGSLHPLQAAFVEHDAFQCGYCTPGQLCSAAGLMSDGHAHTRAEIRETSPDLDKPHKDEKQTADAISRMMTEIADKTFADGRHAIRSVHAKSHGIFKGTFEILSGLPEELAQGFFAKPSTRPAVLRFSTIPGDLLDDSISTPRGLAMKIIGVEGARLEESEQDQNQDFLMVNGPTFNAPNANAFHKNLKLLAPTTDRIPEVKKASQRSCEA